MSRQIDIPCILFQQRDGAQALRFALFATTPNELLKWASIQRRHEDEQGQQRRLSTAKIRAIAKFLQQDARNTIAPAITVAVRPGAVTVEASNAGPAFVNLQLSVPDGAAPVLPAVVIDGQHRLLGLQEFNPNSRIAVTALLEADDTEIAFQFVVINNKATRVSSDLIRTLALDYHEQELSERLKNARVVLSSRLELVGILDNDVEGPFHGIIAFESANDDRELRTVLPAAIESAFAAIDDKNIPELHGDDALLAFFSTIWSRIKFKWPALWTSESRLLHKACIVAVTQFITDALIHRYDYDDLDVTNADRVATETDAILASQAEDFWTVEWKIALKDSKAVRDRIIESLMRIGRNMRANLPWEQDVDLVAR
jgi:DGQHR domain-containing protein